MRKFYQYSTLIVIFCISEYYAQSIEDLVIEDNLRKPLAGSNVTIICSGSGDELSWQHRKHAISSSSSRYNIENVDEEGQLRSRLTIPSVILKDSGKYRCQIKKGTEHVDKNITLHVQLSPKIVKTGNFTGRVGDKATLLCMSRAVPAPSMSWFKGDQPLAQDSPYKIEEKSESFHHLSTLSVDRVSAADNGTFFCRFENEHGASRSSVLLQIMGPPTVVLESAESVNPHEVQLQWSVMPNGSPIIHTEVVFILESGDEFSVNVSPANATSVVLAEGDLPPEDDGRGIQLDLDAFVRVTNAVNSSASSVANITVLPKKPVFVPKASFRGSTKDSLSVSWTTPDDELMEFVDSYRLFLTNVHNAEEVFTAEADSTGSSYLFEDLKAGTVYKFVMQTCMKMETECGPESQPVTSHTLFKPPKSVSDISVSCLSNRTTGSNRVFVTWLPPGDSSNVDHYKIELKASAHFVNRLGRNDYFDNLTTVTVSHEQRNYTFEQVQPNTNYTVKVYAGAGNAISSPLLYNCETPVWIPRVQNLRWWKSKLDSRIVLKMPTPQVSQRNGTICCHRIVVVPMSSNITLSDLPVPKDLPISTNSDERLRAFSAGYVAEAFVGREVKSKYMYLGDGKLTGNWTAQCAKCLGLDFIALSKGQTSEGANGAQLPYTSNLRRRSFASPSPVVVQDKVLSTEENYTGFLIMTVRDKNDSVYSSYSGYFNVIRPIADPVQHHSTVSASFGDSFTSVVYVLGVLIVVLLLVTVSLAFVLCHYHRKRKQLLEDGSDSFSGSLGRRFFRTLRRSHTLMSHQGLDVPAVVKDQLVPDYLDKIKDSELGFRREFEALPEKFFDRSSRASEMTENVSKNRYPDIRAYDQTRVKLSPAPGSAGSDYINANYVMGYRERKKFICAQGPMESTVNDFWRMIVEQRSSMCIMLTNLEETGKVKCVKYWPEAGEPQTFGNITVRLVKEKAYADYLVRTLRAEWTVPNPGAKTENGQNGPETAVGNGTATMKSNSSVANSNHTGSLSGDPPSGGEETKCHEIQQYHYLMWKDFVAPEHPVGLLSFLRRINGAYSPDLGPLLVHCSAGVGRTGTLVALDILVTELEEEGQASIYNTICDLRHQRNFLVQSLKQYVFVHRALMEHAQFGNTEQSVQKLEQAYEAHVASASASEPSPMTREYERLSKVIEDRKAFTVANSDSNRGKNRYDFVLPYDNNCVILMPLPSQIGATYINASFISGFDMGENFIVTQDPLESTLADFWRMVYEQEVKTVVMLSELGSGENQCATYWPEDEVEHEYLTVKFSSSESYPKYTVRSFLVTNNKTGDSIPVTQFQYIGWSGLIGEVPLVTLGIMEVIARVQTHADSIQANLSPLSSAPPTVVHCSGGGDRSSVFVCLSNCLRQLRRENCVDVFQIARKIRSQRQFQLQEFSQYEFVYKALVEYINMKRGENL